MVIYRYKKREMGLVAMLEDQIEELREKLNQSILQNEDYEKILKISVELDQLIAKYYNAA